MHKIRSHHYIIVAGGLMVLLIFILFFHAVSVEVGMDDGIIAALTTPLSGMLAKSESREDLDSVPVSLAASTPSPGENDEEHISPWRARNEAPATGQDQMMADPPALPTPEINPLPPLAPVERAPSSPSREVSASKPQSENVESPEEIFGDRIVEGRNLPAFELRYSIEGLWRLAKSGHGYVVVVRNGMEFSVDPTTRQLSVFSEQQRSRASNRATLEPALGGSTRVEEARFHPTVQLDTYITEKQLAAMAALGIEPDRFPRSMTYMRLHFVREKPVFIVERVRVQTSIHYWDDPERRLIENS